MAAPGSEHAEMTAPEEEFKKPGRKGGAGFHMPGEESSGVYSSHYADEGVTEIESLCPNCEKNGTTRLLLLMIPFFKEVIVMSFECPHCGLKNNEIQSGGKVQDMGCIIELKVNKKEDVTQRSIIQSDATTLRIPEIQFENPPTRKKGSLNTVEGVLNKAIEGLLQDQPVRRALQPDVADQIEAFIPKLQGCIDVEFPYTIILDDPSGNSHVQSLTGVEGDPQVTIHHYVRTREQIIALGLGNEEGFENAPEKPVHVRHKGVADAGLAAALKPVVVENSTKFNMLSGDESVIPEEVMVLPEQCYVCRTNGHLKMMLTDIPHFKQVLIMGFTCDKCGFKTTEIKTGGAIPAQGERSTLRCLGPVDVSRDVLKSDTAAVHIPELRLELDAGTLGGRFSTVEGLLTQVRDQLLSSTNFSIGDSASAEDAEAWRIFSTNIDAMIKGEKPFTFIMDDPLANSYIQNLCTPDPDPQLVVEKYTRSHEADEELGLLDMRTEGYEGHDDGGEGRAPADAKTDVAAVTAGVDGVDLGGKA